MTVQKTVTIINTTHTTATEKVLTVEGISGSVNLLVKPFSLITRDLFAIQLDNIVCDSISAWISRGEAKVLLNGVEQTADQVQSWKYSLDSSAISTFSDDSFSIYNSTDNTKVGELDISGVTTGTTRTLSFPDKDGILATTDDAPADRMVWKGEWDNASHEEYDVVRDGSWTMVANKTTTDRPAPQPVGAPFWIYTGTSSNSSTVAKTVYAGNRYNVNNSGYLSGYRINVVAGNIYEVLLVQDPTGVKEVTLLNLFTANESGWREFSVSPSFVTPGVSFDVLIGITEPATPPTLFSGNWNYVRSSNAPAAGQMTHSSNNRTIRINYTDADTGDREVELQGLNVGDVINAGTMQWAIQSITINASDVQLDVSPEQRISDGLYNVSFTITPSATLSYYQDAAYWPTSPYPNVKGVFVADGGYDDVVEDTNAYGTDIIVSEAYVSPDWDIVASSALGTTGLDEPIEHVITVAKSGGDYDSIKDAIDSIEDNDSTNRYLVRVAPGIYEEDNPIQCKEYVSVIAMADAQTTRITASNGSADLFTTSDYLTIEGFTLYGVTGAGNYAINHSVLGFVSLDDIGFGDCSNGALLNHVSGSMEVSNSAMVNPVAPGTRGLYIQAGNITVDNFNGPIGTIDTLIEATSSDSIVTLNQISFFNPLIGTAVKLSDSCRVVMNTSQFVAMNDGIVLEDGVDLRLNGVSIFNAAQDGIRVNSIGSAINISGQGVNIEGSTRYDLNILASNAVVSGSMITSIDKLNYAAGAKIYGTIIDLKEDDEGTNIIGELHVGTPEAGYESVFGGGDSYTRGMLVYTKTPANVFVDVSDAAKSPSGSSFAIPGILADNAIYIASSLTDGSDVLEHFGIKTKIDTAAVPGAGEIVFEYWNGSTWTEINAMEIESSGQYQSYSNSYCEHSGSHHIRYDSSLATDSWTKNDPMSLGTSYYWMRLRVKTDISTAPVFQQVKLHTNRSEINGDGWQEYFGKARPIGVLPWKITDASSWSSSPGDQDLYVLNSTNGDDYDIGFGREENNFASTARDRVSIAVPIPYDMDTSSPIHVEIYWMGESATAGDIAWKASAGTLRVGDGVTITGASAPTTMRDEWIYSDTEAVGANEENIMKGTSFSFYLPSAIARAETTGFGDFVCLSIVSDGDDAADTYPGDRNILNVRATYTTWCQGGHI